MVSSNPVLTALMAAVFLNERMTWRKAAGLLLGIGGVAFVVDGRLAGGGESPVGVAFTIAALLSLVCGTILFKKLAPSGGLWVGNGVQSLSAGLATLPFAFSLETVDDIVPSLAPGRVARLSRAFRLGVRLSALVPPAQGVGSDGGEFLSLHDASARPGVRLAPSWRAGRRRTTSWALRRSPSESTSSRTQERCGGGDDSRLLSPWPHGELVEPTTGSWFDKLTMRGLSH